MNKFNNKYLLIVLMICILISMTNAKTTAQDNSLIDPLNLNQKKPIERLNYHQTRAIITSISADKIDKTIIIKGLPEITYDFNNSDNEVTIVIPHSYLHKNISSTSYNWGTKLRGQFPDIMNAGVTPDINKRDVNINIVFKYPIKIFARRKNRSTVVFKISKILKPNHYKNIDYSDKININDINTLQTNNNNNSINYKPSGKFITVIPESQNTLLNKGPASYEKIDINKPKSNEYITIKSKTTPVFNKPKNNFYEKTEIQETPHTQPPSKITYNNNIKEKHVYKHNTTKYNNSDLPNPPKVEAKTITTKPELSHVETKPLPDKPTPESYSRSSNDYSSTPKTLPRLDRPEMTTNNLMNSSDYDDLIRIAVSLESENKLEDSIQKYTQAITTDPSRYEAYAALGDVYLKLDNYSLAIQNYEKALNIKSDSVKTIFNLGVSYSKKHESIKAISNFEKALSIQPENYEIKYNLANEYFNIKDYQNAINNYKACIKSSRKSKNHIEVAKVKYNLANTYKANNELDKAIEEFRDSIKIFPEFANAHYNLAAAYAEKSQNEKAINEFEEFIKYTSSKEEKERVKQIINQLKNK